MEELLQKLLEAEVLSEDVKSELEEAFKTKYDEALVVAKDEAAATVRAELTEQYVSERENLIEAIDTKVDEFLSEEINELKSDIEHFRDLEAEYAEKLVESKAAMRDELEVDLKELVEKLDAFLEIRLASELDELREDIEVNRKNDFGRRVFEAFAGEYLQNYVDDEANELSLRETQSRLSETEDALQEAEAKRAELERKITLETVLAPLAGKQREVMEAILRNVDTDSLEEGYKTFIGRVIRESEHSDQEGGVLAESADEDDTDEDEDDSKDSKKSKKSKKDDKDEKDCKDEKLKERAKSGVIVNGDGEEIITESDDTNSVKAQQLAHLRKLAGI